MIRFLLLAFSLHLLLLLSLSRCLVWPRAIKQEAQIAIDWPREEKTVVNNAHRGKAISSPLSFSALKPGWNLATGEYPTMLRAQEDTPGIVEAKHIGAVQWVYTQTKQHLGYPEAFIRHDIEGRVEAELHFDADGRLGKIRAQSLSPFLRVYVYRLLERSLQSPIPRELLKSQTELDLICYFNFQRVESEVAIGMKRVSPILGNKLFFEESHLKSKLAWSAGPISGFFLVPAVALDPLWLLHKAKTMDEDEELQRYRDDPIFSTQG